MGSKEQAEYLFSRIGWGRENAVKRPSNAQVDRILRRLVENWNWTDGEVHIINVGEGYYKPRWWVPVEKMEYKKYRTRDSSRENSLHIKGELMDHNFYAYKPVSEEYEQLSLPV